MLELQLKRFVIVHYWWSAANIYSFRSIYYLQKLPWNPISSVQQKKKPQRSSVKIEKIEDEDSPSHLSAQNLYLLKVLTVQSKALQVLNHPSLASWHWPRFIIPLLDTINYDIKYQEQHVKKNPIYLFYEVIPNGEDVTSGDNGDKHYQCFHGSHKICMIKKSMRGNLNGEFL